MTIKYNLTGAKRKELVLKIADWLGCEVKYLGAPTFAYEVDYFTVDKEGTLIFDDRADSEVIERLLEMLYDNGFEAESLPKTDEEETSEVEITGLSIDVPLADFTENSLKNVHALVEVKGNLIKKAFDIDELPIYEIDDCLDFPWFKADSTREEVKAYADFITALCEMAKKQKRITATQKSVENERYSFRCFLLRLGLIGEEYKKTRKILLQNLEGSSSFKSGRKTKTEDTENA